MKKQTVLWISICLLGVAASSPAAAPPSGTYSNTFTGPLAVWDVSGTYHDNILGGGVTGNYTLTQDAQGKITGGGSAGYTASGQSLNIDFTVNGSVKTSKGVTTVQWTEKFSGTGTADQESFTFSGSVKANLTVDPTSQVMQGNVGGKICVRAGGKNKCGSESGAVEVALPGAMNGTWKLVVTLDDVGDRPQIQNANLVLSNGRAIPLTGTAAYKAGSDQTKLKLRGDNGVQLSLVGQGASLQIVNLTGRVLGQKLKK